MKDSVCPSQEALRFLLANCSPLPNTMHEFGYNIGMEGWSLELSFGGLPSAEQRIIDRCNGVYATRDDAVGAADGALSVLAGLRNDRFDDYAYDLDKIKLDERLQRWARQDARLGKLFSELGTGGRDALIDELSSFGLRSFNPWPPDYIVSSLNVIYPDIEDDSGGNAWTAELTWKDHLSDGEDHQIFQESRLKALLQLLEGKRRSHTRSILSFVVEVLDWLRPSIGEV